MGDLGADGNWKWLHKTPPIGKGNDKTNHHWHGTPQECLIQFGRQSSSQQHQSCSGRSVLGNLCLLLLAKRSCRMQTRPILHSTTDVRIFSKSRVPKKNRAAPHRIPQKRSLLATVLWWYCWWTKSCTTKDDDYPIIYRVLTIPGGAGFCPSTVPLIVT